MIDILYFARIRESLGLDRERFELPASSISVADLITLLSDTRGTAWQLALGQANLLVSVNQALVKSDHELRDGDEVAFFPPVSGG
jgi:molybdopterin synthase sulfur carrier subunit